MMEVLSNSLNENTGHWRMVINSSLTHCKITLVEDKDGITTYRDCPKKLSNEKLIDKLNKIKRMHMVGKNDSFDSVTIEIENLIEEISEKRSNNNSSIGFL
jgi:argininosuccinate synthase